jgi:hypothetical protein
MMIRVASGLAFFGAIQLLGGCDRVPVLTFAPEDGDVDAGGAGARDGQSAIDGGCPGSTPRDATVCCGSIACSGDCAGRCPECESTCASGTFCCAKMNNILCRQLGMPCN